MPAFDGLDAVYVLARRLGCSTGSASRRNSCAREDPSASQGDSACVPRVPPVPPQNGEAPIDIEEWDYRFAERAAILEFDAGVSRRDAEIQAQSELAAIEPRPAARAGKKKGRSATSFPVMPR